jgi:hypothetical protein
MDNRRARKTGIELTFDCPIRRVGRPVPFDLLDRLVSPALFGPIKMLTGFVDDFLRQRTSRDVIAVSTSELVGYVIRIERRASQRKATSALASFCDDLHDRGVLPHDPSRKLARNVRDVMRKRHCCLQSARAAFRKACPAATVARRDGDRGADGSGDAYNRRAIFCCQRRGR